MAEPLVWDDDVQQVFVDWLLRTLYMTWDQFLRAYTPAQIADIKEQFLRNQDYIRYKIEELKREQASRPRTTAEQEAEETKRKLKAYELNLPGFLAGLVKRGLYTEDEAAEMIQGAGKLARQGDYQALPYFNEVLSSEVPLPRPEQKRLTSEQILENTRRKLQEKYEGQMAPREVPVEEIAQEAIPEYRPLPWREWFEEKYGSYFKQFQPTEETYEGWYAKLLKAYRSLRSAKDKRSEAESAYKKQLEQKWGAFPKPGYTGAGLLTGAAGELLKAKEQVRKRAKTFRELLAQHPAKLAEERFREWLAQKMPEAWEEYRARYPYGIKGRPSDFSPPMRTIF